VDSLRGDPDADALDKIAEGWGRNGNRRTLRRVPADRGGISARCGVGWKVGGAFLAVVVVPAAVRIRPGGKLFATTVKLVAGALGSIWAGSTSCAAAGPSSGRGRTYPGAAPTAAATVPSASGPYGGSDVGAPRAQPQPCR